MLRHALEGGEYDTVNMTSNDPELRRRLGLAREAARLTRTDVAHELKVTRQMVSRWEQGTSNPSPEQVRDLCVLYGATPGYLLFGTSEILATVQKAMHAVTHGPRSPAARASGL